MKTSVSQNWNRREFICAAASSAAFLATASPAKSAEARSPLRAAVIGYTGRGDYGHGLESIFNGRPGIFPVALADPEPVGRARTAGKIGVARQYADYRELLDQERPDLVSVAMRHADLHHAIVLAALRAGAHVYCEKPFTTCPAESDELLAAARERGRQVAVAHTMRMTPPVVRLRQAVREGWLGELIEMRAYGKQDSRAGGEDMMVLGSHLFDLFRLFAGDPLWCTARVSWRGRDITRADARLVRDNVGFVAGDQVFAQFGFANGINATFTSAGPLRETVGHWGIEFHGSKGVARLNCDLAPNVFARRTTGWKAEGRTDTWEPLDPAPLKAPPAPNPGPVGDWLEAMARDREPECSGRNGAWAVEMVAGVYHAALTRERIPFPLRERKHPLAPVP